MNDPKYKVNVRCSTYNQSKYITDAMNGFCMQETDFPFICTIVDDASTDGEQGVINAYLEENFNLDDNMVAYKKETEYAYITYAQHKINGHCYFAVLLLKKNHYRMAGGRSKKFGYIKDWLDNVQYYALCEGDDYWIDPMKLQKQVDYMDSHLECGLCHCACQMLFQSTNTFIKDPSHEKCSSISSVQLLDLISGYRIQTPSALIRASVNNKALLLDPFLFSGYFMMGDMSLWWQICKLSKIHYISDPMVVYRQVENSATHQKGARYYRFKVSMLELDYYLVKSDIHDQSVIEAKKVNLQRAIRDFMAFDSNFQSLVLPDVSLTVWDKLFIKSGLLIFWLNAINLKMIPVIKEVFKKVLAKAR